MFVRKKVAFISVLLLASALGVAGYFLLKDKSVIIADPWVAVPSDAVILISTPDFPELLTQATDRNGLLERLAGMKWAADLQETASVIDSITGSREVRELLSGQKALISFHATGKGSISPLFLMNVPPSFTFHRLSQMIDRSGAVASDLRDIGGGKALAATYLREGRRVVVHLALSSGILFVSSSEQVIANALNNKSTGSDIRHQQGFSSVVDASGKTVENIFILFRNTPRLMQPLIGPEMISSISTTAVAAGGDVTSDEQGVFFSGFVATTGAGIGADRLTGILPAESGVQEVLPQKTLTYTTVMRPPSLQGEAALSPASINATDIALTVVPFTGSEITTAVIPTSAGNEKAVFFRMTDPDSAEKVLYDRLNAKYRSLGLGEKHFIEGVAQSEEERRIVYKLPFTGVASILSGEQLPQGIDQWVIFCRSYMIFSSKPDVLSDVVRQSLTDNTLINDPEFRELEKTIPSKSSLLYYASGKMLSGILREILLPSAADGMDDKTFSGIEGVALSLSPSNGMLYSGITLRYMDYLPDKTVSYTEGTSQQSGSGEATETVQDLIWKVKLKDKLATKPYLFKNHNTGATEIFVQDASNNIYLISASGKVLWEASIREKIEGDIFMIDYYKNNKNQILFSGKDYIHLIDRNGNYVDKYPVKFRSPATNPIALFDYEKNKEYRLCVAGEDKRIYMYDRAGTPVKGWNSFVTRGPVTEEVRFFRVKGKDYLVVADNQAVYLLDRTGKTRVNLKEDIVKAQGSSVRLVQGENPAVVCTDQSGTLIAIHFDGTIDRHTFKKYSRDHYFDSYDTDNDGKNEYLFLDQGICSVYDDNYNELFAVSLETKSVAGPYECILSSSDTKTGVYDKGKKIIYLLNENGVNMNGFPHDGADLFTIGRLSSKSSANLLTGGTDNYLYNYEINNSIN